MLYDLTATLIEYCPRAESKVAGIDREQHRCRPIILNVNSFLYIGYNIKVAQYMGSGTSQSKIVNGSVRTVHSQLPTDRQPNSLASPEVRKSQPGWNRTGEAVQGIAQ